MVFSFGAGAVISRVISTLSCFGPRTQCYQTAPAHLLLFDPPAKVICRVTVVHRGSHSVQNLLLYLDQVLANAVQAAEEPVSLGIILDCWRAPGQSCTETQLRLIPTL